MSIPFALNARLKRGSTNTYIWKHIGIRTIALLVMGLYMVNSQYGYDESKMIVPMALWGLLAYSLPIPIWNQYSANFSEPLKKLFQYSAILLLVSMCFIYIQDNGARGITPKWWGILGLIGWAYLISSILYWLAKGNVLVLSILLVVSIIISIADAAQWEQITGLSLLGIIGQHFTNTVMVLSGVITSLLFFENKTKHIVFNKKVILLVALLFLAGYLLRPYYEVSKIRGTPSWSLYSAGFCIIGYYLMYLLTEYKKITAWSKFIMPAAANSLLIYIIPGIIFYIDKLLGIEILPASWGSGMAGILWCLTFTVLMLFVVKILNKMHISLRL
jgi:predicted acyltransferase